MKTYPSGDGKAAFVSLAHTDEIIEKTINAARKSFELAADLRG